MNMRDKTFINLKKALDDALAFERGKRRDLNVTRIQAPQPPESQTALQTRRVVRRKASPNARRPRGLQM
jgi:hypothetical protein